MRGFWLVLHLVGFTLWIGGGVATMVAGIAAKNFAPESRLAVYRIMSTVWRIVVGPAAIAVLLSGIVLSMPFMKSGLVPGPLGLMIGAGLLGGLIAVSVALPATAALGHLAARCERAIAATVRQSAETTGHRRVDRRRSGLGGARRRGGWALTSE